MESDDTAVRCANCGAAEGDGIKLKKCAGCNSVRYCGIKCQKEHRPKHKKACKQRAAELRDELLFKQPEGTHLGDCPICCLPLHHELGSKTIMTVCCSTMVCKGCHDMHYTRQVKGKLEKTCIFCRAVGEDTHADMFRSLIKRVEANDANAVRDYGYVCMKRGDHKSAVEHYLRAIKLGDIEAHSSMAAMYQNGHGVEKDEKKMVRHLEEAAIGGHINARRALGRLDWDSGRFQRGIKHWTIASTLGCDLSIVRLKDAYNMNRGFLEKEDLAAALRAYQAAVDARTSKERDIAYKRMEQFDEWLKKKRQIDPVKYAPPF